MRNSSPGQPVFCRVVEIMTLCYLPMGWSPSSRILLVGADLERSSPVQSSGSGSSIAVMRPAPRPPLAGPVQCSRPVA
eukprot:7998492-Pyramimonas_sp.AAC.1